MNTTPIKFGRYCINGAWGVGGTLAKLDTGAASTVRDSSLEQDPGGKVRILLSYDSLFS